MATNKYSLADHLLTVTVPAGVISDAEETFVIGGPGATGEGSFVGSVSVSRTEDVWKTVGDETGSWVHNKSLNRTGSCSVELRQVSDMVIKLSQICNVFEAKQDKTQGMTLSVSSACGEPSGKVAVCEDCYIKKVPEQKFGAEAEMQSWEFTCGRITFYQ